MATAQLALCYRDCRAAALLRKNDLSSNMRQPRTSNPVACKRMQLHRPPVYCRSAGASESTRVLHLPHITYSSDWTSIDISELEQLLESGKQHTSYATGDASSAHSSLPAAESAAAESHGRRLKLAKMLSNSMLVIAASVRSSSMPNFQEPEDSVSQDNAGEDWRWLAEQRRRRRRKVLVGCICVGGDKTLVSTLYNVVVHPDLRGRGLGGKMIRRACHSVFGLGIGEVAVMAPKLGQNLFQACSFGPDEVCKSMLMLYKGDEEGVHSLGDPASHLKPTLHDKLLRSLQSKKV
mmetsp:Transcript_15526/g.43447  ORF Transcript_15526/g.43447 Transcript_15526/m.43447 type:complete len:293 (-) Transcript_15526:502-1380(-)